MKCAECRTRADCEHAFGKYWKLKSGGGVGCKHPFSYVMTNTVPTTQIDRPRFKPPVKKEKLVQCDLIRP